MRAAWAAPRSIVPQSRLARRIGSAPHDDEDFVEERNDKTTTPAGQQSGDQSGQERKPSRNRRRRPASARPQEPMAIEEIGQQLYRGAIPGYREAATPASPPPRQEPRNPRGGQRPPANQPIQGAPPAAAAPQQRKPRGEQQPGRAPAQPSQGNRADQQPGRVAQPSGGRGPGRQPAGDQRSSGRRNPESSQPAGVAAPVGGAPAAPRGQRRPQSAGAPAQAQPVNQRGRAAAQGSGISGPRGKLRVIPLGGVGEVGKNMTLVEYERDMVLLDCGGKFPEEEQRGIDLIIPDVTYVKSRLQNLRAIIITHGHEDHIGGLPYILPQLKDRAPIPIYGSPMALGFIETKLNEARMDKLVDLRPVQPGDTVQLGQLSATFIHVTHSIPDTNAVAVHSPVGTIIDTADFKFDPTPVMGGPTDERLLRKLGDDGVLALFSDTVRVETAGSTPSERVVLETMDETIRQAKGQVIVATFASNISRLHMALQAAQKYGRKVAVAGRSMEQNARVALDLGYLNPPEGLLMPLDEVLKLPKHQRVFVITGSQGEAAAALARIAAAEHPKIRVGQGDVVLVSATPVPGNEETVTRTIDNLFRRGAKVVYSAMERGVHVSGHAGRDELRRMIDLLRPKFAVPIHGEFRHMVLYRQLCGEAGISADRVLLPEIGGVIEFTRDTAQHRGKVPAGSTLVDRISERTGIGQVTLRDRSNLMQDGLVVVTLVVDRENGGLIAGPDMIAKGLRPELENGPLREAEVELKRMLDRRHKGEVQYGFLMQRVKETVGKTLSRRSKSRPLILPVVTEL
jgi:ribonuclease J